MEQVHQASPAQPSPSWLRLPQRLLSPSSASERCSGSVVAGDCGALRSGSFGGAPSSVRFSGPSRTIDEALKAIGKGFERHWLRYTARVVSFFEGKASSEI
jgi:hypothetical protein